jgi:hypothetical protein
MSKGTLTATKLRLLLIIGMILIVVSAIAGFYFAQQMLSKYASEISNLNANAEAGNDNIQTLRSLEDQLANEREAMTKARSIVAQSQQYLYQDQIVEDLSKIAGDSGVVITQFDFASTTGTPGATSGSTTPPPASSTPSVTSGLKSETVNVTIKSPLQYTALMNFIKAIELNPLKMQIASISLTKDEGSTVTSQAFTIEVYVK